MKVYDPLPDFNCNDPQPFPIPRGSRKILGGGRVHATSPQPEDGFIAQEKRAAHWLGIWERFWSGT